MISVIGISMFAGMVVKRVTFTLPLSSVPVNCVEEKSTTGTKKDAYHTMSLFNTADIPWSVILTMCLS